MGDEEDEEESDAVVTQVLDELGLQLGDQLTDVPATGGTLAAPAGKGKTPVAAGADVSVFFVIIQIILVNYRLNIPIYDYDIVKISFL